MVFLMASVYWYFTGHSVPTYFGFILLLSLYNDRLYFATLVLCAMTISAVIYYFWLDFFAYQPGDEILQHGAGIIYMLVIFLKAKKVFNNDQLSLD